MPGLARVCPRCGALNGAREVECVRCHGRLLAPWIDKLARSLRGLLGDRGPLTSVFFLICALSFTWMSLVSGFSLWGELRASDQLRWGALFIDPGAGLVAPEPWRYLSAVFFHFGAIHIVFNMMALGGLGSALEQKLGSARFGTLYVLAGVIGFIASDYWHRSLGAPQVTGGASGAIFGLMGASSAYKLATREPGWKQSLLGLGAFVIIMTFLIPSSMMALDHAAHLGGVATGLLLGYLLGRERRPYRLARFFQLCAALGVALSLASIVACQVSPEWKLQRQLEIQWGLDL